MLPRLCWAAWAASLAQEVGTSAGRVRLILLEREVVLRPRSGNNRVPDPERIERAKTNNRGYKSRATLAQLGHTYGVSATTARNLVRTGGGDLRTRGSCPPVKT